MRSLLWPRRPRYAVVGIRVGPEVVGRGVSVNGRSGQPLDSLKQGSDGLRVADEVLQKRYRANNSVYAGNGCRRVKRQ